MLKKLLILLVLVLAIFAVGCTQRGDDIENQRQEKVSEEAAMAVSAPAVTNFWEKRQLKTIYELRDSPKPTFCYIFSQYTGKFTYMGVTIGYGIPYATQFNNPERYNYNSTTIAQAEPNALFSPPSAAGTWVLMETSTGKLEPQFIEENVSIFTYKLPDNIVINP